MYRRSILAIAVILILTPTCKEEGGKQYPKAWQKPKLSKAGGEIAKTIDKAIELNKGVIKDLKASKAKLDLKGKTPKEIDKALVASKKLHDASLVKRKKGAKDLDKIHRLLIKSRKRNLLTPHDVTVIRKKTEALEKLSLEVSALKKEFDIQVIRTEKDFLRKYQADILKRRRKKSSK